MAVELEPGQSRLTVRIDFPRDGGGPTEAGWMRIDARFWTDIIDEADWAFIGFTIRECINYVRTRSAEELR